jgi:FSR family fosmidomycin resistance protein-like MFS transporter
MLLAGEAVMGGGIDRRGMAALSAGHLGTDLAQGSVPAIMVYVADKLELSNTLVGVVMLVATASSSLVQPLFGIWSDRRGAFWLLSGGVALSGVGVSLAALSPSYGLLLVAMLAGGLGVAAFHPEGSKFASYVSGERRATGMAVFSVGGNLGFGLGPLFGGLVLGALGLDGGLLIAVPGLAIATLILLERRHLVGFEPGGERARARTTGPDRPRAFLVLQGVVALRSIVHYGLFTFVPLWEVEKGASKSWATVLLSFFLIAGAVGTLCGGPLADRFGRKPMIVASYAATVPLVLVYALVGGVAGHIALVLSGASVISTFGITVVLSQEYMPSRIGLASGLTLGLAIGLGGVFAVALGGIADSIDRQAAIIASAVGPAAGAVLALWLPRESTAGMVERTAPTSTVPEGSR